MHQNFKPTLPDSREKRQWEDEGERDDNKEKKEVGDNI